jgi:prepilin-type N-terminal cleavage/methylation domain-containing protein
MGKISSEIRRLSGGPRRGFSLVEVLVVVLIMGILVGVVGSLMGGFITNFEVTDDQSIARRRAQDVFNVLQFPMLYAGMGIPASSLDYYFGQFNGVGGGAPIMNWASPLSATSGDSVLRVVYSIPSGVKHKAPQPLPSGYEEEIAKFSASVGASTPYPTEIPSVPIPLTGPVTFGPDSITLGSISTLPYNVHSYITFPGIRMHPEFVTGYTPPSGSTPAELIVSGMVPKNIDSSNDVLPRNIIRAFHDLYFVRAGVAYVDANHTFVFADVTTTDYSITAPLATSADGYRVEGIKAMHVSPDVAAKSVTVYVIAEGDNAVTGRSNAGTDSQAFRNEPRWNHLIGTYDPEVYYEEFRMQLRSRNIEAPGA